MSLLTELGSYLVLEATDMSRLRRWDADAIIEVFGTGEAHCGIYYHELFTKSGALRTHSKTLARWMMLHQQQWF